MLHFCIEGTPPVRSKGGVQARPIYRERGGEDLWTPQKYF